MGQKSSHSRNHLACAKQAAQVSLLRLLEWKRNKSPKCDFRPEQDIETERECFERCIQLALPIQEQFREQPQNYCCSAIPEHVLSGWNPLPLFQVSTGQGKDQRSPEPNLIPTQYGKSLVILARTPATYST